MSRVVFLSHILSASTPSYGNRSRMEILRPSEIDCGHTANSMEWRLPNHLGTHLDAPRHFFNDGRAVDQYPASNWIFRTPVVIECKKLDSEWVMPSDLEGKVPADADLVLLKTGFERFRGEPRYWEENPGIHPDLASWIRRGFPSIRALGMDLISTTSWRNRDLGKEAHRGFLSKDPGSHPVILIEDMKLSEIGADSRPSEVVVAPLRVQDADGAPCTVFARLD